MTVTLRVKSNRIAAIMAAIQRGAAIAVEETAAEIQLEAQVRGHEDTSSMVLSIYASGPKRSDYSASIARAEMVNPGVALFPEVRPNSSADFPQAVVGVAAEHGIYEEMNPGHEFFDPSIDIWAPLHPAIVADAIHDEVARVAR